MSRRSAAASVLLTLLLAVPAVATTIVPLRDGALVDRAELIVEATIEGSTPVISDRPATDWLIAVDEVLKGELPTSHLVVRLTGGEAPNGLHLRIYGTPAFAPGVRAILFLGSERDGVRRIVEFPQGAFLTGTSRRRDLAFRDFTQVRVLGNKRIGVRDPFRDADRFTDWIADRAVGFQRTPDYLVRPRDSEIRALAQNFTLTTVDGTPLRWFQFDSGGSITWRTYSNGIPGLAGGGANEAQRALQAWNDDPSTPIRLLYAGTSGARLGLTQFDNFNVILWNDPNDEIEGKFDCSQGGTVAKGGPWYSTSPATFGGKSYYRIVEADIIFRDGIECRNSSPARFSKFIEEVAGHEIGHTLGIGHSSEQENESNFALRDALMYFRAHDDHRGARLTSDDLAALRSLYVASGGPNPGPNPNPSCPAGQLCLLGGRFRVTATWENQFDGTSGSAATIPSTDLAGFLYFTDPSNIELVVKILDFGSEIKVFYSQLTNLRFTLRVTDTTTARVKTYGNTAGDCGAFDNNFLAGTAASASAGVVALAEPAIIGGRCVADASTLCLLDNRFAINVDWRNQFTGASGTGLPRSLSRLSGAFAFDNAANLELLIKTLDFGDRVLVLYGALSNLEYSIRVTEAATGRSKTYSNPAGNFCGGIDNSF